MARVLLALLLMIAAAAQAREPDALAVLDDCATQLDPGVDVGYERIAARCPDLTQALEHSPWAAWLPAAWKEPHNHLNAEGLRALHDELAREAAAVPGTRVLQPERVHAILARLAQPERPPESWWARCKRWLRELLTPQPQDDDSWLRRLFGDAPIDRGTLRLVAALSIALLVILAAAVVVNELRVAGLLKRRPLRAGARAARGAESGAPDFGELDGAEPRAQPALLLALVAARLVAQDRLPPARAFTVRELTRRARLEEPGRVRLAELARVSERVRYAADAVPAPDLAAAVRGGRELLLTLEPPAAAGVH